jgi:hypothetical protein
MGKVTVQLATTILANSTTENVLAGNRFERAQFLGMGELYCAGSNAGLLAELNVGGRSVTPPTTVNAQNRLPVVPDDLLSDDWLANPGDLIQIRVQNTTGGNLTFNWKMQLTEMEYQVVNQ